VKAIGFAVGLALVAALHAQEASACTSPQCTKIIDNGPDAGRKVVVVMGDGYAAADQASYNTQVANLITSGMFDRDFFREQHNAFNVYRLNLESAESGVDRITYNLNGTPNDGSDDTVISRVNKNTALHYAYSGEWSHCWLEHTWFWGSNLTENAKNAALNNNGLAHADYIIVLLNEAGFGGCNRGPRDIVQTRGVGWDVVAHEAGHGIGGLWDEYSVEGAYTGGAVNDRNCSTTLNRSSVFWNRYIDPITPVPTTLTAGMDSNRTVGMFEGCGTRVTGIYRPVHNCRMNGNTPDFCPVCKTLMRKSLYPNLQHNFNNAVTADFNGDGRQDVLVHNGGDLALYRTSTAPHRLNRVWAANNYVPAAPGSGYSWTLTPGDRFYPADFDGDGDEDLYVFNTTNWGVLYIGLLRANGTGLETVIWYGGTVPGYGSIGANDQLFVADFNGDAKKDLYLFSASSFSSRYMGLLQSTGTALSGVVRYDNCMPGWCMSANDKYTVADFDGDNKDDLFVYNSADWADKWLGMVRSSGAAVSQIQIYGGTLPSGWNMAANDQHLAGDFDLDGKDDLYVINTADWSVAYLEMTRSTGTALQYVMRYDDDAATTWATNIPGWTMKKGDRFWVSDANKDGRADLFVYNPKVDWSYEYLGALTSNGAALSGSWSEDWVGNWNLGVADQFLPANYEGGVGKADLFVRNTEWFGLIRRASWGFTLDRIYFHWIDSPLYDSKPWSDSMP
jgi:hypothetical protein